MASGRAPRGALGGGDRQQPPPVAGRVRGHRPSGELVGQISEAIGHATNNVAEWRALIAVIRLAADAGATELTVRGDSRLVIEQAAGRWKIKAPHLAELRDEYEAEARRIPCGVRLLWVRREENTEADALSTAPLRHRKGRAGGR